MDRRWLWPLVGVVAFVIACLLLGWWQWDRSQSASGTARNIAYALEWPSFAGFAIYMVIRAVKLERTKVEEEARADVESTAVQPTGTAYNGSGATSAESPQRSETQPSANWSAATQSSANRQCISAPSSPADPPARAEQRARTQPGGTAWTAHRPVSIPDDDPELASYNRYLAMLNAADQRDAR